MTSDIANYGEEHGGKGVRAVVRQNLDAIESGIDAVIDGVKQVVHDFREQAQEVMDAILDRMYQSWKEQRPRIDAYMAAHPWVVFGGMVLLAYVFSGNRRMNDTVHYQRERIDDGSPPSSIMADSYGPSFTVILARPISVVVLCK